MKILKIENKEDEPFTTEHYDETFEITTDNIRSSLRTAREAIERNEREHPTPRFQTPQIPGEWVMQEDGSETWLTPEEVDQRDIEEYMSREQRDEEWARRNEDRIPISTFRVIETQISEYATLGQIEAIRIACIYRETNLNIREGGDQEDPQNPRYGNYPF